MAKKNKQANKPKESFNANPFSHLKGFAVSAEEEKMPAPPEKPVTPVEIYGSFEDEMGMLGVQPLNMDDDEDCDDLISSVPDVILENETEALTDDDLFLSAMTGLNVDFKDDYDLPEEQGKAIPRRMKQIKQGRLKPESKLDLHGCTRNEVIPKIKNFLQNAQMLGMETLLIVTGRGLHSEGGEPVLRNEVESYLNRNSDGLVAEWSRAPKEYGGEGALILFVRKKSD
jgi:DNA-nicking Smr family endonuclease